VSDGPVTWSVEARNLPEHAGNPIHTDEGAHAAGFPAALVAGVTTYAYLTHPLVAAWGLDWVARGGGEVRFRAPVFAGDTVRCVPSAIVDEHDDGHDGNDVDDARDGAGPDDRAIVVVDAVCADQEANPRASLRAVRAAGEPPPVRDGERLRSRRVELGDHFGADYGWRAGDDLACYLDEGVVHPAVWPAIANRVVSDELVRGPWIHTRSIVRHHALARVGTSVDVHATVVDRYERSGHRAVVDVVIDHDGAPVATLEHEAIVELAT
jgi:acyl dehydratase